MARFLWTTVYSSVMQFVIIGLSKNTMCDTAVAISVTLFNQVTKRPLNHGTKRATPQCTPC